MTTITCHARPAVHEFTIHSGRSTIAAELVGTTLLALATALLIHNAPTPVVAAIGWLTAAALTCSLAVALFAQLTPRARLDGSTLHRGDRWRHRAVDLAVADVWVQQHRLRGRCLYARDDSGQVHIPLEPTGRGPLSPGDLRALAAAIHLGPHRLPAEQDQAETVVAQLREYADTLTQA